MSDLASIDFLRVLVPDLAAYWKTLFGGLWALNVPVFIYYAAWIFLMAGFAIIIYEIVLTQSLAPLAGKAVRLVIAVFAVGYYPNLLGASPGATTVDPASSPAWKAFHGMYAALYQGQNSFYARWAIGNPTGGTPQAGPVALAMKKLVEAYSNLLQVRVAVMTADLALGAFLKSLGVGACDNAFIKEALTKTPMFGGAIAGVCEAANRLKKLSEEADRLFGQADNLLIYSIMIPMGAHALIIYSTLVIFTSVVILFPLLAAFLLFRGLERAFPTAVGLYFASFLALGVSAVAFGATSYVLYNSVAAIWERWGRVINQDLKQKLDRMQIDTQKQQSLLSQYRVFTENLERELDALKARVKNLDQYLENGRYKSTPWPPDMTTPTKAIQYTTVDIITNTNPPSPNVRQVVCPGTEASPGLPHNQAALEQCLSDIETRLQIQQNLVKNWAEQIAGTYTSVIEGIVAKIARFKITLMFMVFSSITLSFVLVSAMILLVVRIVGIVQGFELGKGLGPIGGGLPK